MQRRSFTLGIVALPFTLSGCSSSESLESVADPLIGGLTSSLGLTQNQAAGGVGSVLTLAQEKLAAGDFDQVAAVIPGASKYLDMAKSLGAVTGPLGNVAGLNSALGRLGVTPEKAAKLVPAVGDFVSKASPTAGSLLSSVLK
jgi:hypothetical protein